ncbi:unnamed protein product [Protopolystoma xenopodis]|uniref:Fibronectin type-III domain-containing protein n=1 Tax=Protopolystoma xenopodis TaxID=117903 RepID=A0A3S5CH30_9PLAT|nr:unnamed protein product [Protopolystoma xenopodis]
MPIDPSAPGRPVGRGLQIIDSSTIEIRWSPPVTVGNESDHKTGLPVSDETLIQRLSSLAWYNTRLPMIEQYLVEWAAVPFRNWASLREYANKIENSDTIYSKEIKGLELGVEYQVRVSALNVKGKGPPLDYERVFMKGMDYPVLGRMIAVFL